MVQERRTMAQSPYHVWNTGRLARFESTRFCPHDLLPNEINWFFGNWLGGIGRMVGIEWRTTLFFGIFLAHNERESNNSRISQW